MRAVGLSDLDVAVRVLIALPRDDWAVAALTLIEDAHTADLWRKRHGVAYPGGGTGSLYAQASLYPRATSTECCSNYCSAMMVLLAALEGWRKRAHR